MTSAPLPPVPLQRKCRSSRQPAITSFRVAVFLQACKGARRRPARAIPLQGGGLTRLPGLGVPAPDSCPTDIATELGLTPTALVSFCGGLSCVGERRCSRSGHLSLPKVVPLCRPSSGRQRTRIAGRPVRNYVTSSDIDAGSGTSHTVRNSYRGTACDFEKGDAATARYYHRASGILRCARRAGTVSVVGAVRYPGTFDIMRDERLSSLLGRAGGLTDEAYPLGSVFTRISAQQSEAEGNYRRSR